VNVLEEKKGENILLLDINGISDFTDYFILCSGTSVRMLDSLADEVTRYLKSNQKRDFRVEGETQEGWLLIDCGNLIVHIFSPERREYYRLEELWGRGKVLLHLH
jgi:ribosome-associated protein